MSTACTQLRTTKKAVVASLAYPELGSSQHLCLIRDSQSEFRGDKRLLLDWQDIPKTVLGGIFSDCLTILPTPLSAPLDRIELPPISRASLRERPVMDANGKRLGTMVQLCGILTCANRILTNYLSGSTRYDYETAVRQLLSEAPRMFASAVKRGVLRHRETPGLMAHAVPVKELAPDEVGISETWASKILSDLSLGLSTLENFPCRFLRFPIANEFAIQEGFVRVLPGNGRYIGLNPWNLSKLLLGDADGDLGNAILRVEEYLDGKVEVAERPRIHRERTLPEVRARLTVQNLFDDSCLQKELALTDKGLLKFTARYDSLPARLQAIEDADTRAMVAILTTMGWSVARTLAASGRYPRQEAYRKAYNMLEPLLENCFDARKVGASFSGGAFDIYQFTEALLKGKALPIRAMEEVGIPQEAIETLKLAWDLSERRPGRYAGRSPVYRALVSQANSMERSCRTLLAILQEGGVAADKVWRTIVQDLNLAKPFYTMDQEWPTVPPGRRSSWSR